MSDLFLIDFKVKSGFSFLHNGGGNHKLKRSFLDLLLRENLQQSPCYPWDEHTSVEPLSGEESQHFVLLLILTKNIDHNHHCDVTLLRPQPQQPNPPTPNAHTYLESPDRQQQGTFGMQSFFILPPCGILEHTCNTFLDKACKTPHRSMRTWMISLW